MTTIKFRRDTSANWTSVNPIPAQGEPCYETDTGKLKIGNGSDNYVTLPYVSDGGGSSGDLPIATATTLGGVKIGNNLSITEDGTLSATGGSAPDNMVTTDTEQVIPSIKLFRHPVYDNGFTQIQGASISLLRYDREEVGRINMGSSSKGITFYCAGQDNMVFQMDGTSTRYFDFLASSGNIMNRMRYYGGGSYYDIFNAGNLIPSSNITISEASDTGVHIIDISKTLLDRIIALETTVASLQTQIGEISAQLDAINGEVI